MTFTGLTVIIITFLSYRKAKSVPMTFAFSLSMFIGALIPIQFSYLYRLDIDVVTSLSIAVVFFMSSFNMKPATANLLSSFRSRILSTKGLMLSCFLFALPGLMMGIIPILTAIETDLVSANLQREVMTKEILWSKVYITVVFRMGFMLSAFSGGIVFSGGSRIKRISFLGAMLLACTVSVYYVQKANPLFIIIAFFLGRVLSGDIKMVHIFSLIALSLFIMLSIGYVIYGANDAFIFLLDMTTRRMTEVPFETLSTHFDFYHQAGAQFLNHSFTFLTGNEPLPQIIYSRIGGSLSFGWANSMYVGDLVVNFGYFGCILVSAMLGLLIRMGNYAAANVRRHWPGRNLALFGMAAFVFSLSNNALFSGVQIVLISTFIFVYIFFYKLTSINKFRHTSARGVS